MLNSQIKREVTFNLELRENGVCVFTSRGCPGYYLWATDKERVLVSVIPLAQHIFWMNDREIWVPSNDPDLTLLLTGPLEITFVPDSRLTAPEIAVEGMWMSSPHGREFFIPQDKGNTCARIVEQIQRDLSDGM